MERTGRFRWAAGLLAALCLLLAAGMVWASRPEGPSLSLSTDRMRRAAVKNHLSGAWTELEDGALLDGLGRMALRPEGASHPLSPWLELTLYDGDGALLHTLAVESGGRMWLDGQPCRNEGEPLDVHALSRLTEWEGRYRLVDVDPRQVAGAELSDGHTGRGAVLREEAALRRLVENLSAVAWEKGEPVPMGMSGSYLGVSLSLKEGKGALRLEVLSPTLAVFQDCYYYAVDGEVDTEALEALVAEYES